MTRPVMLTTSHGDGAGVREPVSIEIIGRYADRLYARIDGHLWCTPEWELAIIRRAVESKGHARFGGVDLDESMVTTLIAAMPDAPELEACRWCERAGVETWDARPICEGHLRVYSARENGEV